LQCSPVEWEMASNSSFSKFYQFLLLVLLCLYTKPRVCQICTLTVNTPQSPHGGISEITYPHRLRIHPSPALVTFKFCTRKFIPHEQCQVLLRHYHSYCLNEVHESDLSFLDMLHVISFENPVKLRNPININSLVPLDLNLDEFIDTINSLVDNVILTNPREMASLDILLDDCFHLMGMLDYTDPHGSFLEFGSHSGKSTRLIEKYFESHPYFYHSVVHGFDSFQGLPEQWREGFPEGYFDIGGIPPYPETKHIRWNVGFFDHTVPPFMKTLAASSTPISFMHIDCDLYSSASTILSSFLQYSDQLLPIDSCVILLFNELIEYDSYKDHEIKAFYEFYQALIQKYHESSHIVLELLPRASFLSPETVGFRLCLFQRINQYVARKFY
jgi:hypothetical protein